MTSAENCNRPQLIRADTCVSFPRVRHRTESKQIRSYCSSKPNERGAVSDAIVNHWSKNLLLGSLNARDREVLLSHLEVLALFANESLYKSFEEIKYVYFPLNCIVATLGCAESKATVEVGLIGPEGMTGATVVMGPQAATSNAFVLTEGKALRLPARILRKETKHNSSMRESLLSYAHFLMSQYAQLAACHHYHTTRARLIRLLLMTQDRLESNELKITQSVLATLLGTRRATVTEAVNNLQKGGTIQARRRHLQVLNRAALEQEACDCYKSIGQFTLKLARAHS
jgi:CRP-like cAMP-binding protein